MAPTDLHSGPSFEQEPHQPLVAGVQGLLGSPIAALRERQGEEADERPRADVRGRASHEGEGGRYPAQCEEEVRGCKDHGVSLLCAFACTINDSHKMIGTCFYRAVVASSPDSLSVSKDNNIIQLVPERGWDYRSGLQDMIEGLMVSNCILSAQYAKALQQQ